MSEVEFLEDSHETSSSYSDSSEVADLRCGHSPDKVGGKNQLESLQNHVGHIGWCQCGKCHAETRETDCLCCKDLIALDELKQEGILFYVIF